MYKVIRMFSDLLDGGHVYKPGDIFPRDGTEVTEDRINELSTAKNRRGKPLIQEAAEEAKPKPTRKRVKRND